MNNRDFKFWLHGLLELGEQKNFSIRQLATIRDHIAIVDGEEKPDEFVLWLKGAIDIAVILGRQRSKKLYETVEGMLDLYFEKITPNNKKEIQEACDSVIPPINYDNLEKVLRDLDRGIGPIKPIVPFVTNPPSVVVGESVRTIPVENTVYCSNAN